MKTRVYAAPAVKELKLFLNSQVEMNGITRTPIAIRLSITISILFVIFASILR